MSGANQNFNSSFTVPWGKTSRSGHGKLSSAPGNFLSPWGREQQGEEYRRPIPAGTELPPVSGFPAGHRAKFSSVLHLFLFTPKKFRIGILIYDRARAIALQARA